ncbi:MAG: response regulator transcription factor [Cyanobacteriota bacterium]|nr:response regulator transcription factor [Cyanobacteriota bacterium]
MAPPKILVVDDDPAIRTLIHRYLSQQDYQVESAGDGKSALASFDKFVPELIVLDVNLPDTTGFQLCKEMQKSRDVFVLMLTSLAGEADKLKGFNEGADDYITKPFGLVELGARVRARLKRSRAVVNSEQENLSFGDLAIAPASREVTLKGELISLTALEFNLFYCLASKPGHAFSRSELLQKVWDYEFIGHPRVVDVHVGKIRKKIEPEPGNPKFLKTVQGYGYKFEGVQAPE